MMKNILLLFILLSFVGRGFANQGFASNKQTNEDYVDQLTLQTVLTELQEEFKVTILYKNEIKDVLLKIQNQNWSSFELEEALNLIHQNNPKVTFNQIKKDFYTVSLTETTKKEAIAPEVEPEVLAPKVEKLRKKKEVLTRVISGTVTSSDGVPVPGAHIVVKNTDKNTITDFEGKFNVEVADGPVTLVISSIGYTKKEIEVSAAQSSIEITMDDEIQTLEEVIVVAYDEQSKASYTGSAVDVDLKGITSTPRASFQESLQGNVAGVQSVAASGQPGYVPDIRIRGIGSINASSDPLYVIDGIPVVSGNIASLATSTNTIAGLNPNDIESLTVLKDASATSIYGSRGANGVILITTKKGSSGKTKIDVNLQTGVSEIIWADRNKPLNTAELSELVVEGRINNGDTREEAEDYIYSRIDRNVDTDWFDVITRTGQYQQLNVSASGGSDKTNFYTSLGYYNQEGVIIGIDYEKLNAKVNVRHSISEKLTLNLGLTANTQTLHTNSEAGSAYNPIRSLMRVVPWESVYNEDGSYNTDILLTYNPVGLVNENIRESKLYGVLGNIGLRYDIIDNLSFETRANLDFNLADEFQYDNPYFGAGRNDGGRGYAYNNKIINWNVTNMLKYSLNIDDNNAVNFTLGQEAQKTQANSVYAYASNYGAPGLTTLANASVFNDASSTMTASSIASYFLSANYSYKSRYYLNLTGRRDGSSRFGSDVRYANFGSIGLGWNIHKEEFFNPNGVINELKVRASYGINGNQGIGDFESRGLYNTGADYNGQPGYVYAQQSNPVLTWEKNKPFNVGVDFLLFKRLSGTIEYYNRVTSDLLLEVPLSGTNGITSYLANIGEMKNQGWELTLSSLNIDSDGGFSWKTDLNLTTNSNEITALQDNESIVDGQYIREVGTDFYTFYMPGYAGVDPDNGEALWYTDETKTETTNSYSAADPYKQGSGLPKFYGGLTNTFSYKNFTFSFLIYANWGNKVYDYWGRYNNSDGSANLNDRGNMTRKTYENRWQEPGDITDVPKVVWGNTQSGTSSQHSTRFLYDGSYVRLRDVTLAYQLPFNVAKKAKLSSARVYVKGGNLLTYVKDKDIESDPEVGISGSTNYRIPPSKQFVIGLDLSF
ncbi:MAG: SusC/RagA family TonB-linked outer membrane protein [Thalassobius sp.]|nr:SusC/RagA family TonB-linked outer membrane protein [Thalassovita sp.]